MKRALTFGTAFCNRPTPVPVLRLPRIAFIFATNVRSRGDLMFTVLSAMMQNLPFARLEIDRLDKSKLAFRLD
jgi:hypothetical protein